MALAPDQATIGIRRRFTTPEAHPYDGVTWARRDARISNHRDGSVAFEQLDVEFPASWSLNATNIVAQKYFRGTPGTDERETSLRQVIDRVTETITRWGRIDGYFADDTEADAFEAELKHVLVTQRAAFNSPVWFNIGVEGVPQQASACFILSVDDEMDSILNWYVEEGTIFKGGSGSGINLSRIRSSLEPLKGGGTASGPVSFMRGADASAGTIKSGGKTRRAAKMVILNADHPDIEDFVWCKAVEERKARALRDAGFDMDLDGKDAISIQYQNANNSVRVTDEFMRAVEADGDWHLRSVMTGETLRTMRARDLFRQIARSAWECADPGMQFDTTINHWHTAANTGRINGSNPCFTGDTLVNTDKGLVGFAELFGRVNGGEQFRVYTHDVTNSDAPAHRTLLTTPDALMITGRNPIVRLRFDSGLELRCTPGHRIFTTNRGYVEAADLTADDRVRSLDLPTPAESAEWALPVTNDVDAYRSKGDHTAELRLPEAWSDELAHYLGWLIGDGTTSTASIVSVYGSAEDRNEVLPQHQELVEWINGGRPLKISEQGNGTVQLRLSRRPVKRFLEALGVASVTGEHKVVPWSVEQAPPEVVAGFLRGLFDADGCVRLDPAKGSYVGLGSISVDLLRGVQRLLSTFGITSRIYPISAGGAAELPGSDRTPTIYQRRASYDLRISSAQLAGFASHIGFTLSRKAALLSQAIVVRPRGFYEVDTTVRLVERTDEGVELTYNLREPRNHSYVANGVVVRNCSEYMHLDDSACNLASINLLSYLDADGTFDVEGFRHTVEVMFTAQEILVGNADYPTEGIAETSRRFRQLGLGYANLGAVLMALGLPYDSDQGRALAASITALMTGHAYATSARTAARMGPFAGYHDNAEHMLRVLRQHRAATRGVDDELAPPDLLDAARQAWDVAVTEAERHGVRNSQASVLAPTGTIGLMMDCDTTGIEPDLGLIKYKKLVGGGTMSIVNHTVPRALSRLGYDDAQIADVVAHIDEHNTILTAPHVAPAHHAVFACAMGDNPIHHMGHVKMMGAVQPFISGAISKTVNMPEEATVADVEDLHLQAWKLGLKAVAIYRDNCKVAQPLSSKKDDTTQAVAASVVDAATDAGAVDEDAIARAVDAAIAQVRAEPIRKKLPKVRSSTTFSFRVADCHGYLTVGEYPDGRPGEIFLMVAKQGSTLAGIMDAFAISVSHGLQYGVPLRVYVEQYTNMRFEPAGITDDPDLRIASSLIDYIFRRLALEYLPYEERVELGVLSTSERAQPTLPGIEEASVETTSAPEMSSAPSSPPVNPGYMPSGPTIGEICQACGSSHMQRAGSCMVCADCGSTSGCS